MRMLLFSLLSALGANCNAMGHEARLRKHLLDKYGFPVRPVKNNSNQLVVFITCGMIKIVELNLIEQLLSLDLDINQEWTDYKLSWDPADYGGLTQITIPSDIPWKPDLQLYNTRGTFTLSGDSVSVLFNGLLRWRTKTITATYCEINVRAYPFDIQTCKLEFGSWTHNSDQLRLAIVNDDEDKNRSLQVGMDLSNYIPSPEWDIMAIPVSYHRYLYPCCPEHYSRVLFTISLRRHWKFYFLYLILPLIGLSYLSLLVFYLPADSREKMTLCMSLLASQIMFLVPMIDNIPETSVAVPLLGKIIIFNLSLLFSSIACSAFVLNIHYRKPSTHKLPGWVKALRSDPRYLGKILMLDKWDMPAKSPSKAKDKSLFENFDQRAKISFPPDVKKALKNLHFVHNYIQHQETAEEECDAWKFLASVADRAFLLLFNIVFVIAMIAFLKEATTLFDNRIALRYAPMSNDVTGD